jgi:alpha-ketoglutarate-dependent taurine dioxygenase
LQLSKLSDAQRNELALLIAERGVVIFRGQDFKDIGPQKQKEFGEYFGRLHIHVRSSYSFFLKEVLKHLYSLWELTFKTILSCTISTSDLITYIVLNADPLV